MLQTLFPEGLQRRHNRPSTVGQFTLLSVAYFTMTELVVHLTKKGFCKKIVHFFMSAQKFYAKF